MPLKDELVPKPRLKLPNVSSEIVDNNIFRESLEILLLAAAISTVKQLRKNQLPGGRHHASEGRASAKTTPKNSL